MATSISRRKEEILLTGQINELKKKSGALDDKEIQSLQAKEKRLKNIKKEQAAINKVREEGEQKVYTLMSRVESLQKHVGKSIEGIDKRTIDWSNAAHQTGLATIGIKNDTDSVKRVLENLPNLMHEFATGAESLSEFMKEGTDAADELYATLRKAGDVSGTMVDLMLSEES